MTAHGEIFRFKICKNEHASSKFPIGVDGQKENIIGFVFTFERLIIYFGLAIVVGRSICIEPRWHIESDGR
jgi:hypothetical protein